MSHLRLAILPYLLVEDLMKDDIDASVRVEQKKRGVYPTMFCIYCKNERVENETPCSYCGAPSSLREDTSYRQEEPWQGQQQPSLLPVPYQGAEMQRAEYQWY